MNIIGIIPARYGSTRLPAKPLLKINGKPLIIIVWENMKKSKLMDRVIVATDDERIVEVCKSYGADVVLTSNNLISGTDRVFEAYEKIGNNEDIIVNIQGDEPLLLANNIDELLNAFINNPLADVGTLITKIYDKDVLASPNVVKVVIDNNNLALYFSRSIIPYNRDEDLESWCKSIDYWKHIGAYAYKKDALYNFVKSSQSKYERVEKLEQLRLLENGFRFYCVKVQQDSIGVDTQEDLELVRKIIK